MSYKSELRTNTGRFRPSRSSTLIWAPSPDHEKDRTILALFKDHNEKMNELVGKEFSQKTADRYDTTYRHIAEFMKKEFRRPDMMINEVDYNFICIACNEIRSLLIIVCVN